MANFTNYKYKEFDYAKCVYENGFQTKHIPTELKLLLLYARDEKKIKKSKLKDFAIEFCEEKVDGFNRVLWFKAINKAVSFASENKNRLLNVDSVPITSGEVDYVVNIPVSQDYKKLFFAFLVQMKLNKIVSEFKNRKEYDTTFFKGGIKKYNEIKKMANVSSKLDINGEFIHDMSKQEYIAIYYNGLIKHLWMGNCQPSGEVVMEVKDYENVGYYLDYYCGVKGVKLCKECGQPFKTSQSCKTYCKRHKEYYKPIGEKSRKCVDCGAEFTIDARNNTKVRCSSCQKKHRQETDKIRKYKQNHASDF